MKLAIVTTHPIQYNAPWFRLLADEQGVEIKVFYTWEESKETAKYDPGFGKVIEWDLPLLDGYDYTFVKNESKKPGSNHFSGVVNPTLNKEIVAWGAGAVLVFGWPLKSHLKCMRYFKGKIPVLFRGDSTLLDEQGGFKQLLRRQVLKYIYKNIDYALYVGTNNKEYFKAHGLRKEQLVFVPHAIDNERFASLQAAEHAAELKKELGINNNTFVILFAGKLIPKKDPHFLLQIAKKLPQTNLRFVFVGNGELEAELKKEAKTDHRIAFLGFQNQSVMPAIYNICDVYVLPSKGPNETWGLAINEAMAAGKYVITTNKVGCAADLVNEDNGAVVEPGDVDTAAAFIEKITGSSKASKRMKNTNEQILQQFSFASIVTNIKKILERIG